ncbi:hypothetical protein H9P43_010113 [Blastocladiella emersonii ATCC 22665]|nr:hypothetical protein H9P43_010113 [Blastocladiella emersonii ATCC 22665]
MKAVISSLNHCDIMIRTAVRCSLSALQTYLTVPYSPIAVPTSEPTAESPCYFGGLLELMRVRRLSIADLSGEYTIGNPATDLPVRQLVPWGQIPPTVRRAMRGYFISNVSQLTQHGKIADSINPQCAEELLSGRFNPAT